MNLHGSLVEARGVGSWSGYTGWLMFCVLDCYYQYDYSTTSNAMLTSHTSLGLELLQI